MPNTIINTTKETSVEISYRSCYDEVSYDPRPDHR